MHSPPPCLDGWVTDKNFYPRGLQILWLTVVKESWSAVHEGAGQGVHMPKPKFSIKTEVLGGGGVQWLRLRLRQTPPPPCTVQLMLFC